MATERIGNERLWSEWLSLYLEHCRRELSVRQLAALADALSRGVSAGDRDQLASSVSERVAVVAGPLVDFIATARTPAIRHALVREAVARLRASTPVAAPRRRSA